MTLKPLSLHQKRQLVGFLELICQELELTETQFHDAKQKYEAVGHWLDDGAIIKTYGPMIIPQGSISLGTTLRPIGRDEFDIDLVCKLINAGSEQNQAYIRNIVGARLRENKTYVEMLESLNRGWRLNYAKSSKFHLDITPAVMNGFSSNGEILVPDRKLKKWKPSNPEGYVQWFEKHASRSSQMLLDESEVFRAAAKVEPLPEPTPFKSVLKRTVQILKRHRDIYFQNRNSENSPISIIITTLAANSYAKAVISNKYESELDLLYDVVANMHEFISARKVAGKMEYVIPNETTNGENFAEKWNEHPERADAFFEWQRAAINAIEQLARQEGLDKTMRSLMDKFGETETSRAFSKYTDSINMARANDRLKVNPLIGLTIGTGIPVKHNIFFGK